MITQSRLLLLALPLALVTVGEARAGTVLTEPATGTGAVDGNGLTVTNTQSNLGTGHPRPFAIAGIGTGISAGGVMGKVTAKAGYGLYGETTGPGSATVFALNQSSGFAGDFRLTGVGAIATNAAVHAVHSGGSPTGYCPGGGPDCLAEPYGNAGNFSITNGYNSSDALVVTTSSQSGAGINATSNGLGAAIYGTGANIGVEGVGVTALYGTTSNVNGAGIQTYASNGSAAVFRGGSGGTGTCTYNGGPGWNCTSDRNLKENFTPVDLPQLLDRLSAMPVYQYQMKQSHDTALYLGPTAQDFHAAFGLGQNEVSINTANAQGVALAATKGLYDRLKADEAQIAADRERIAALEHRLAAQAAALEQAARNQDRLDRLEAALARLAPAQSSIVAASLAR